MSSSWGDDPVLTLLDAVPTFTLFLEPYIPQYIPLPFAGQLFLEISHQELLSFPISVEAPLDSTGAATVQSIRHALGGLTEDTDSGHSVKRMPNIY